jgi:hypothetical protein
MKLLENLMGVGEVYREGIKVSRVTYKLNVQQEVLIAESQTKTEEVDGLKLMTGTISVIEGEKGLWMENRLALHFEDGRKVGFILCGGDWQSGIFQIRQRGGFY